MIELCQKPSQRRVLVAALPGGDDLFLLPLAHEWDEDEVVGIVKAVGAVAVSYTHLVPEDELFLNDSHILRAGRQVAGVGVHALFGELGKRKKRLVLPHAKNMAVV